MKTRQSRKKRMEFIANLINTRCISSQKELLSLLTKNGYEVTQSTLSRDLNSMDTKKVVTDRGVHMYVMPQSNALKDRLLAGKVVERPAHYLRGFVSLTISGNMAVIKTRNGYAPAIAFDIDSCEKPEILGTIAGGDTIFAVLRNDVSVRRAREIFSGILHLDKK